MKVLMILPEFGYGGAEKSFCNLSVLLSKHYVVSVVVFNRSIEQIYNVGGKIYSLDVDKSLIPIQKISNFAQRVRRLRKLKDQIQPDISISFLEGADFINILTKRDEKVICSLRGSKIYDQNIKGISRFLRINIIWPWLYNKADSLVAVNHGILTELKSILGAKPKTDLCIIQHQSTTESDLINSNNDDTDLTNIYTVDSKVLCSIGRLAPEKGIQFFLPIFKRLLEHDHRLKYVIAGDGDYLKYLLRLCSELNLKAYTRLDELSDDYDVYFLGYVTNPKKLIAKSSLFVFPSTHEGWPNVLLDAIHLKTPIIASDCPYGPRELLFPELPYEKKVLYPLRNGNALLLPNLIKENKAKEKLWLEAALTFISNSPNKSVVTLNQSIGTLSWVQLIQQHAF